VELISRLGVDLLILMSFTEELSSLSAEEFVLDVLLRGVGAKKMWVGKNHLFGVGRRGDAELLKQMGEEHGFEVGILDGVVVNGVKVSSTKIREWISQGKVREVIPLLGHLPFLNGKVTSGEGIGREVGYPTCNLSLPNEILIPASGVYAVHVRISDERFFGVANVGCKPTFKGEKKGVEVHLFDFQREIYGSKIRVFFVQKIRDEKCFKDKEALRVQLKKDESIARAILRREEDECQNSNQWFWKNWKSSS
jgi:riboflavin kinase/FMN adenylyltransferase